VRTLNLGILAHVDAGKTSLTERLLHAAGVIDQIGRVDDGNTQTDSLALERQRGITIKSAVVSFVIDDVTVNLIDTPGHPDFIAEVERVLGVLDGAILVISAVEGVQPQTRVLMRALQRLRIPTVIFVNKIDRGGADGQRVLNDIRARLAAAIVPMGSVSAAGTHDARFEPSAAEDPDFTSRLTNLLTDHDDDLLAAYVADEASITSDRLRAALAAQTGEAVVRPVFFGSAMTGAGIDPLMAGITQLLPAPEGESDGPVAGTVFKIDRGPSGEKIAYVRLFSGTLRSRDRVPVGDGRDSKVTAISVFDQGAADRRPSVTTGQIAKVWGLGDVRIGDEMGIARGADGDRHHFSPPTLATVVVPRSSAEKGAMYVALTQLSEQDPLINLRQDDIRNEISLSLYGEVQKEVIQATLADDFGVDVEFRETTTICVERPIGSGEAVELLQEESNPFRATIGLRIEPAPHGSGIDFRLRIDPRTAPTHIFKNVTGFQEMMGQYVRQTLQEGLFGWQVTDCVVTMTKCAYSVADGPPSTRGPDSTAADFRKLTPLVLMSALRQSGTSVCEPIHGFHVEVPVDTLGAVLPVLPRLQAVAHTTAMRGPSCLLEGEIPAARVHELQQQLPALTHGEGTLESAFDHYQPATGPIPTRPRTNHNPLNRKEYLLQVEGRVSGRSAGGG
jgi:ribosomal protection tetracycline resistance protein